MKQARIVCGALALLAVGLLLRSAGAQETAARASRQDIVRFAGRVDAALARNGANKADWGVLVSDADSGEVLYARNADHYFVPASNAKLFTTAMALATLGPEFRIRTTIESATGVDKMGRLRGDLVLMGRGDANLSNRIFPNAGPYTRKTARSGPAEKILDELAEQVAARGVKRIDGDVVADDSDFVLQRFPSGWTVDDTVWGYGAAVSAIAVNDNVMTLEVRPGAAGQPLRVSLQPRSDFYQVRSEGITTAAKSEPQLRLTRDPESRVFVISGSLPADAPARALNVAVPQPAEQAAAVLLRLLEARGVRVRGRARARHAGYASVNGKAGSTVVLAEHVSQPLLEDVRLTNKTSQNLHAELMLRVAAREKASALTMDDALLFAAQFRESAGVAGDDVVLHDGSGLSRNDLVTPRAVVQLLQYAMRQAWGEEFANTLPVAGEDGTLEERMKGTAAAGRVRAKTGTVDHVSGLSGFATTARGEHLIFSMFGNGIGPVAVTSVSDGSEEPADGTVVRAMGVLDTICVAMVEELGVVPESRGEVGKQEAP